MSYWEQYHWQLSKILWYSIASLTVWARWRKSVRPSGSFSMTNLVLKLRPWCLPKRGENRMWEPCSQPRGELRVTLILLFVAGPIGVHPPPSQHVSPLHSRLLRHGPLGILWCLPSGVARYIPWLLKPLERVRWLRYSVSSYARFVYRTVGAGDARARNKTQHAQRQGKIHAAIIKSHVHFNKSFTSSYLRLMRHPDFFGIHYSWIPSNSTT